LPLLQNTRLVTTRQRQEIYALNRIMTRLENDKFKKFCQERGFKGDLVITFSFKNLPTYVYHGGI
jgi:hypothetical protein